jgi:hypothetical protein
VKSLVALRHVDPPKPWGAGPENESLADEVLDELYRRDLISSTQRDYFAGACTRTEAKAAHLPDDPVLRAAQIVRLFTNKDERAIEAIRVAVTSQSTRKRIRQELMNDLATALILRAVADDPDKVDQIRRYMRYSFGKAAHRSSWEATGRDTEQLVKRALIEVREAIGAGATEEPGPASLELAVRASYPLIVSGRLNADRGSAGNTQPDRRTPGEVLDAMRRSIQGTYQLGQTLRDFASESPIRAVDEEGHVKRLSDGSADEMVSDNYLRNEFPPYGKAKKAAKPGDTPTDHYNRALEALGTALNELEGQFTSLTKVVGDDGQPLVDVRGVEPRLTDPWRDLLKRVDEEMIVWARTFRKKWGTSAGATTNYGGDEAENADPYAMNGGGGTDDWDHRDDSAADEEAA